ncbi:MAG TPA: amidohydrolase family protein [Longimicrobium sp.]
MARPDLRRATPAPRGPREALVRLRPLLAAALLACAGTPAAAQAYVIRTGHVLDVSSMTLQDGVTLLVENGVVTRRWSGAPPGTLPVGATVVDLSRYTVLPGLIDAHVHLTLGGPPAENARRTVEAGFTTVADLGSAAHQALRLRARIAADSIPGPAIIAAGSWIGGRGGVCEFGGATVRGEEEARSRARADLAAGASLLKVCVTGWTETALAYPDSVELTPGELGAVAAEAAAARVPVAAHAIGQAGALQATRAGARLLAHTPIVDSTAAGVLGRERMCVASTLATVSEGAPRDAAARALLRLRAAGARIVVGTDAGVLAHGTNAAELLALRAIGFGEAEVLRAATVVAADCLGLPAGYGALREGGEASLVAVAENPLLDLTVLQRPAFVMARGRVVVDRTSTGGRP